MHCMVDLETLGTSSRAAIVQIGAVAFDLENPVTFPPSFLANVDPQTSIESGLEVDGDTIAWWMQQENKSWLDDPQRLYRALELFSSFYTEYKCETLWCHATFDAVILQEAYRLVGMKPPFHYRDVRDLRTIKWAYKDQWNNVIKQMTNKVQRHNALVDAFYQASALVRMLVDRHDNNTTG